MRSCSQGLSRLLSLLSNFFNLTLGEKLLEHLRRWNDPEAIAKAKAFKQGDEVRNDTRGTDPEHMRMAIEYRSPPARPSPRDYRNCPALAKAKADAAQTVTDLAKAKADAAKAAVKAAELEKAKQVADARVNELNAELANLRNGSELKEAIAQRKKAEADLEAASSALREANAKLAAALARIAELEEENRRLRDQPRGTPNTSPNYRVL